jgi:hypothetical protein
MRQKAKLLPALAFSMAFVPVAEIAAIAVAARHDVAVSSIPSQPHRTTAEIAVVQDPFSPSSQATHAGAELIMVNSTPVWVRIH